MEWGKLESPRKDALRLHNCYSAFYREPLFFQFPDGSLLGHCCEGLASHTISAFPVYLILGEVYRAT